MKKRKCPKPHNRRTQRFDPAGCRKDFPILKEKIYGKPFVYLDNAATTQKPAVVIRALERYYKKQNANIHRGVFYLSELATQAYEVAREKISRFINAAAHREVIFVRGATEGINLVAQSYGRAFLRSGDEIVISAIEHHSNIVPWQILCEQIGARLRVIGVSDVGELDLGEYERILNERTKLVAITHVSNALGTVNPVKEMVKKAHECGAVVLVDGAQAIAHQVVDVRELDADFYVFSGHKMYGPTGIGVVYGKSKLLEEMPPYQAGGDMISSVTFEKTQYNTLPYKFEAGTPHIAGVIGLGAAVDYLSGIGMETISVYEEKVLGYALKVLREVPGLRFIGEARKRSGIVSFVFDEVHAHDVGTILDQDGIAVRAGHHCAMPVMDRFGVPATVRASFGLYNTESDVDRFVRSLRKVKEIFR